VNERTRLLRSSSAKAWLLCLIAPAVALAGCFGHTATETAQNCASDFGKSHVTYVDESQRSAIVRRGDASFRITLTRACPGLTTDEFAVQGRAVDQIELPFADEDQPLPQAPPPAAFDLCDARQYQLQSNMDRGPTIWFTQNRDLRYCEIESAERLR
jgi:hypothetical protein